MKKCPFCAEFIKGEAVVCRYCGKDIPKQTDSMVPAAEYASITGMEESQVVQGLREGRMRGRQEDGDWFVSSEELLEMER